MAAAVAGTAITTQIVPMVQGAGEAAKQSEELAKQTALDVAARAEEVRARNLPIYDYEKVFFNSAYSVGLFGLGYAAVKMGQILAAIGIAIDEWGITGNLIDDVTRARLNQMRNILNHIDSYLTPSIPLAPVAIVAAHAGLEYVRKRKFMDKKSKIAGDVTVALAGTLTGVALWQSWVDPYKDKIDLEVVDLEEGETYKGYMLLYDPNIKMWGGVNKLAPAGKRFTPLRPTVKEIEDWIDVNGS